MLFQMIAGQSLIGYGGAKFCAKGVERTVDSPSCLWKN